MSVKVKLIDLVNAHGALLQIGDLAGVPQQAAFRVARVIRKARTEMQTFNDRRRAIVKEHAKDKVVPHPQIPGEVWVDPKLLTMTESDTLDAAMTELGATEIDLEVNPIKRSEFGDKVDIKATWLADVDWLIIE